MQVIKISNSVCHQYFCVMISELSESKKLPLFIVPAESKMVTAIPCLKLSECAERCSSRILSRLTN